MSRQTRKEKYFGEDSCASGEYADVCPRNSLLPDGIKRLTEEAICATRLMPADGSKLGACDDGKVKVAAFDFDGTCLSGSSPKKLVDFFIKHYLISVYKMLRIGFWALAYKLNLPNKDPNAVRRRVFSAFKGFPAIYVNDFMCRFYHERIAKLYRADADACMLAHLDEGHSVVLISASFEPIIASAMGEHPIPIAMATRMTIGEDGCYTGKVDGLPTEGPDKIIVLRKFLDDYYGEGNWVIGWAYGDHYSDVPLLEAAEHPCAVTPDPKLRSYAEKHGWDVLEWS